jgi:lysophospholipase L1-like esterase
MSMLRFAPFLLCTLGQVALAAPPQKWIATWATSPQSVLDVPPGAPPGAVATPVFKNQTIRMNVRASIGGKKVRVQLSNQFGESRLSIGAAHIALHAKDSEIVAGSDRTLTFGGKPTVAIPVGARVLSDPVELEVAKLAVLSISVFVPEEVKQPTMHGVALRTTYVSKEGNFTGEASIPDATEAQAWFWINAVDVLAPANAGTVVAIGDSITDGNGSTINMSAAWPSVLAERLVNNKATQNIAVVNRGISGNRLLTDGFGLNVLARFDEEVLGVAGAKWLIVLGGINDLRWGGWWNGPKAITPDDVIAAMKQIVERAHTHGIKVIGATLTPYGGAPRFTEEGEAMRQAVNNFIRTGGAFDVVIDFDAAVRDPAAPKQFRAEFSNDKIHPNDAGHKAMANAIPLAIFK